MSASTDRGFDRDVVIVGGGPAGCSAGVFTARAGLDTLILDRGRSSLRRCAYVENYLGFPGGVDVETLYDLMHDHATAAGCDVVADAAESVERTRVDAAGGRADAADGDATRGFVVRRQDGDPATARRVVAATRYGGEYLRGLDDAMFETHEHDGETRDRFVRGYADDDGTTPVEGLYVASPSAAADRQAVVAAGRGARTAVALVEAVRRAEGYPEAVAAHYDWARRERERSGEWADRDRWQEWFDERLPDDHDLSEQRRVALRERAIDRRFDAYLAEEEVARRTERGHDRLLDHVDDDRILAAARRIRAERGTEAGESGSEPGADAPAGEGE